MSVTNRRKIAGLRRFALGTAIIVALTACSPIIRKHGYVPVEEDLALVQVGVDTRETVVDVIGAPVATGLLEGGDYYYVASHFRHYGPLKKQEIQRDVVVVVFDAKGTVANVEHYGLEDGNVVTLSRRVTTSATADKTFLRQLLGNIGNIDAGQFIN